MYYYYFITRFGPFPCALPSKKPLVSDRALGAPLRYPNVGRGCECVKHVQYSQAQCAAYTAIGTSRRRRARSG
jgi:hypothetical protein